MVGLCCQIRTRNCQDDTYLVFIEEEGGSAVGAHVQKKAELSLISGQIRTRYQVII